MRYKRREEKRREEKRREEKRDNLKSGVNSFCHKSKTSVIKDTTAS
jgi:hypothetical protein